VIPADFNKQPQNNDAEALIVTTLAGNVVQWDQNAETMFGYAGAEAIGHPIDELIVVPDQVEDEKELRQATAEDGFTNYETIYHRKDGSMIYVLNTNKLLRDPRRATEFIISNKSDMTQFNRVRDTNLAEEKYGGLLESMPDGIIMVNVTGHIVLANSQMEKIFGYERGELLGQFVEVLVPERFRGTHTGQRNTYFCKPCRRPMHSGLELYGRRKDGTEFPVEISLGPLQPEKSTLVISAIRDVSERNQAARHPAQSTGCPNHPDV
jgi:protein-histidine pros-kinase